MQAIIIRNPRMEAVQLDPYFRVPIRIRLEEGKRRTLGVCTFGIWNEDAYQLWMDADTLKQVLDKLDPNSLRAAKIAEALENFTLAVDFEQDEAGRIASYRAGREALKPALEAKNGSTTPVFYAVGNAHIDLGLAVANGGDPQKDRENLCGAAASPGGISGI